MVDRTIVAPPQSAPSDDRVSRKPIDNTRDVQAAARRRLTGDGASRRKMDRPAYTWHFADGGLSQRQSTP